MKTNITLLALILIIGLAGCHDHRRDHVIVDPVYDYVPPLPPTGIVSTSLDNAVRLDWRPNQEPDLAGYNIYVANNYDGPYTLIGSAHLESFIDRGARNGVTAYYAITAYDFNHNESELSRDVVYDTPRPEGFGVTIYDRFLNAARSGYYFRGFRVLYFDTDDTDFFVEYDGSIPYLVVWEDSDIQDMGYTVDLDEISVAPEAGWSPTKDAQAIVGHTYVVWTYDNHFAKVRITSIRGGYMTFDWAYQTAEGNPELLQGGDIELHKGTRNRHKRR